MTAISTLSSKYQISIPKVVREAQHWEAGQEFFFIPKGNSVLMMPAPTLEQFSGIANSVKGAKATGYRDRKDRY